MSSIDEAPEVVVEAVMNFLTGRDLGFFSVGSRRCRDVYASEQVWESVVRRRWFMPAWTFYNGTDVLSRASQLRPKMLGAATWARAYREAERRCTPPRTWMTTRNTKIVAKGRQGPCAIWATVAHARDCRTITLGEEQQVSAYIELRVLVQNVGADRVGFRPRDVNLTWLCCDSEEIPRPAKLRCSSTTVLSHSNSKYAAIPEGDATCFFGDSSSVLPVELYEWVAFSALVCCPECAYEADFLERALTITLPFEAAPATGAVVATFAAPEVVDRWYTELPGGFVLLVSGSTY